MVYRHDGTDDHDSDELEPEFDDDLAPHEDESEPEPGSESEFGPGPEYPEFEYPGPSAYDIALSENETLDRGRHEVVEERRRRVADIRSTWTVDVARRPAGLFGRR